MKAFHGLIPVTWFKGGSIYKYTRKPKNPTSPAFFFAVLTLRLPTMGFLMPTRQRF